MPRSDSDKFILWFNEIGIDDIALVGGKNASLGEMYRNLTKKNVKIPNGFAVSSSAYWHLLESTGAKDEIKKILSRLNTRDIAQLQKKGQQVRDLIRHLEFPNDLEDEIKKSYNKLCKKYGRDCDVAVRSSATAEDLPDASFAGQQETFLNVRGEENVIDACKRCFASLFTNRAISYREDKGFDQFKVALSIGIQKMVRSDLASSGVIFTIDTESGFKDAILITSSYGLGETVVQGEVNPDEFYVFKPTLKKKYNALLSKKLGSKEIKMIYREDGTKAYTKTVSVPENERDQYSISDKEILMLANWALIIEEYYTEKKKKFSPMDIEWAKDGVSGELFIVQARPETVQSQKNKREIETYSLKEKGKVLASGRSVGEKIASGNANVIKSAKDIKKFKKGEILITEMTDPDWEPIMKISSGIVTNRGGRTSHAAIVSRELGIPCVVGCGDATEKIKTGMAVTLSCAEGEEGRVYKGRLKFSIKKIHLDSLPKTKTKIMMNLGDPEQAFSLSFLPVQGIGLAREEFIINSYIKIHPRALLEFDKLNDDLKEEINKLTKNYADKKEYFVDKLSSGIALIAAAFYPHNVIVRLSDFKSNEYAHLIGGESFEPKEDNPMIGWRGASRYYSEEYRKAFALECKALKKVRDEMGLSNVNIMIPFCRTVEEGKKVIAEMKMNGLVQGMNKLKVYAMCEVPSNVILAEDFLKVFDGFSIGTNDLTQLTLGVDRDSELVAHIYDERDPAVKALVEHVIKIARKNKKYIGLCGDAPSTFPEFARFLVESGIESISLSPDAVISTLLDVAKFESEKRKN